MILRKRGNYPVTTIRLLPSEKQLIRVAAAILNKRYQVYLRETILNHATAIVNANSRISICVKTPNERKVTFIDE